MTTLEVWLVCILLVVLEIWRRDRRLSKAYRKYIDTNNMLCDWLDSRPFLFIGQCHYAQSLVLELIEAQHIILKYDSSKENKEHMEDLYEMLNDLPPDLEPPEFKNLGGFL